MPTHRERVDYLLTHLTPTRAARMVAVASARTRFLGLALEDIYQPHNASAVLRSADAFGIQNLHLIESRNTFDLSRHVARGANLWLDLHKYPSAEACVAAVKASGHRVVATSPAHGSTTPDTISLDAPLTVFIGTEKYGLTEAVMNAADEFLHVPMRGFTESLNLSVCAALIMQRIVARLDAEQPGHVLKTPECDALLLQWLLRDVPYAEAFMKKHFGE